MSGSIEGRFAEFYKILEEYVNDANKNSNDGIEYRLVLITQDGDINATSVISKNSDNSFSAKFNTGGGKNPVALILYSADGWKSADIDAFYQFVKNPFSYFPADGLSNLPWSDIWYCSMENERILSTNYKLPKKFVLCVPTIEKKELDHLLQDAVWYDYYSVLRRLSILLFNDVYDRSMEVAYDSDMLELLIDDETFNKIRDSYKYWSGPECNLKLTETEINYCDKHGIYGSRPVIGLFPNEVKKIKHNKFLVELKYRYKTDTIEEAVNKKVGEIDEQLEKVNMAVEMLKEKQDPKSAETLASLEDYIKDMNKERQYLLQP